MFTKETYDNALLHFQKTDKPFYDLLKKHGHLNDAPSYPLFVNMIRCILTQWVYLKKSGKVRNKLPSFFNPEDILKIGVDGLVEYGSDRVIAERAIRFAEYCTKNQFKTLEDIFKVDVNGIGVWTKNVCAVTFTLSSQYEGPPYNALTTGDPVLRKGIWSLHNKEAYNSYINKLNELHAPYGGLLTWYLWREFNHKSVKLPKSYVYWNTTDEVTEVTKSHTQTKIHDYFVCKNDK
jgi:3-methyladenine DNA glycosylase/8-oxoguanine DNA glycosylase